MSHLTGDDRGKYVRSLFTRIAPRYDLLNRLMTGGQDVRWRREVIHQARLAAGERLLDIGAGTGDLAREALRQQPGARVVAADFTPAMMQQGNAHGALPWCTADALHLPFADDVFDVVVSGFLLRNVGDIGQALKEQLRVLKPGGRMAVLDTTRPRRNLLTPFVWVHLHVVIPLLGRLIGGSGEAYRYLPDSTERFLSAEELQTCLQNAGFGRVGFARRMLGTVAIHWGEKMEE